MTLLIKLIPGLIKMSARIRLGSGLFFLKKRIRKMINKFRNVMRFRTNMGDGRINSYDPYKVRKVSPLLHGLTLKIG